MATVFARTRPPGEVNDLGDSTVAGMVYRLSPGAALEEAVRYGIARGAATLKSPGTELLDPDDWAEIYASLTPKKQPRNDRCRF